MEDAILRRCKGELINGYVKKRHPFRYFTLATLSGGQPRQRTVVLRKLVEDFSLLIYTDRRSQKVADFDANTAFSALFYHPKKLLQIKLEGQAQVITEADILEPYWKTIQESSKKDYTTTLAPGTHIKHPDHVNYKTDGLHFCAIQLVPHTIEYLQLKRPNHIRLQYTKANGVWNSQFLVP